MQDLAPLNLAAVDIMHTLPLAVAFLFGLAAKAAQLPPLIGFVGKELLYEAKIGAPQVPWVPTVLGVAANALMVATLLSPWGGIKVSHSDIVKLPTYFAENIIPVMHGMPPYDYFAIKPKTGRIPIHRTDVGLVILADLLGSKTILFIKDEDGLYTADPKKQPDAEFIPEIGARDLMERDLDDLVIKSGRTTGGRRRGVHGADRPVSRP